MAACAEPWEEPATYALLKSSHLELGVNNGCQMAFLYREQAVVCLAWSPSWRTESSPAWRQILVKPSGVVRPRKVAPPRNLHLDNKAVDALHDLALYWVVHRKEFGFHR